MVQSDVDVVKTCAELRELGATEVRIEITRAGTLKLHVEWRDRAPTTGKLRV